MRSFRNDYGEGAAPRILEALVATNYEQTVGYTEGDPYCEAARRMILEACELDDASIEFCIGGTSANTICVAGMLKDYEGVICTPDAHINTHETGSIAACGRTVLATGDADGFLSVEEAQKVYDFQTGNGRHMTKPGMVYITDTTERGGVWDRVRFDAICDWAHERGLKVYLDGARLGSALMSPANDLDLPHIAHRVDAFTIGGTKNGMLFGEAVVITDPGLREDFPYLQKERGGLMAKGRLLGVQYQAAFTDGYYFELAAHANECSLRLREGLLELGWTPLGEAASNQQFFIVDDATAEKLIDACGCEIFYRYPDGTCCVRFVCSWATETIDVDELLAFCAEL
jgi:threonine aldolase